MKKFFIVLIVLLAGVLLVVEDFRMADRIARIKEAEVADYRLRLPKGGLDFNGPERQGCIIENVYYIYSYQTCFILNKYKGDGASFFQYVYHKPVAFFRFYDRSENSYYFNESALGKRLAVIREE
jgi:hypothetical protein